MPDFAYFQEHDSEQFTFYKIPKVLFTDKRFSHLSTEAKIFYGVLLDRVGLSKKNGWIDKDGNVYIQFTVKEMKEYFHWSNYRLYEVLKELDIKTGFGLIERKRTGCNKPNVIYVKNFASILQRNRVGPDFRESEIRDSEQSEIRTSAIPSSGFPPDDNSDFRSSEQSKNNTYETDLIKNNKSRNSELENSYGAFGNVLLNEKELKELQKRFPYDWREWIEKLSSYMASTGKSYQSHYATICSWAVKEKKSVIGKSYEIPEGKGL